MQTRDSYNLPYKQTREGFVLPEYGRQSIAEIIPTILDELGGHSPRPQLPDYMMPKVSCNNVVLLIVDGFGYQYFEYLTKHSVYFKRVYEDGRVYSLTTVFPSTTPAALTTLHSGLTPQEHGLLEWYTYFEEFQKIIMPLQFRIGWNDEINSLLGAGGRAHHLYPHQTSYQLLREAHVESFILTSSKFYPSVYNDALLNGASIITYDTLDHMLSRLKDLLSEKKRSFISAYWGEIDSAGHEFGPDSSSYLMQIEKFAYEFDKIFGTLSGELSDGSNLLFVTSDHGQINVNLENLIYLEDIFDFAKYLYLNRDREIIVPYGSPNDVFLLTHLERREELIDLLQSELRGIASVHKSEDLLALRYFGLYEPSEVFIRRVGHVCIIPYPGRHVWFQYSGSKEYDMKGLHGGLSRQEMVVPLSVSSL